MDLPSRIHDMLLSADFEFNQLAAIWVSQNVPSSEWNNLLEKYSHNYSGEIFSDPTVNHSPVIGVMKRWKWDIIDGNIYLIKIHSIWSQIDHTYKHSYNTNSFNLSTLKSAIQQFQNGKEPDKTEPNTGDA